MDKRHFSALGPLLVAIVLCLGGCGTQPVARRGAHPSDTTAITPRLTQQQADDVSIYAIGLVGTPYRYGGNTPATGFDCSGLIGHVYQASVGVAPPRTVSKLQDWGYPVVGDTPRAGDLVLFAKNDTATHAGIYIGGSRFVHAPSTGGEVRLDDLTSRYWAAQPVMFRRP
ncbi:MAG: C40 family peptidase [Rhodoferax sp.]|nr:C40 family peptidase [Rhodoferax sp.]